MSWARGPYLGLDFESSGVEPATARIVTACCAFRSESDSGWTRTWLADAGGEVIPDGAIAVHGITTEKAHAEGRPEAEVAREVHQLLHEAWSAGMPVVAFNAVYDLTLLHAALLRAGDVGLILAGHVLCPLTIDRGSRQGKVGGRKLGQLCELYGVRHSSAAPGESEEGAAGAHDATADVLAALRLLWVMVEPSVEFPRGCASRLGGLSLTEMQDWQAQAHREFAKRLTGAIRYHQPDADEVSDEWPYVALEPAAVLA